MTRLPFAFMKGQPASVLPVARSRRLATPAEQALEVAHKRLTFGIVAFVLAFLIVAGRLTFLCLTGETPDAPLAQNAPASEAVVTRADITDRNGAVLATSLPTTTVCADATQILNPDDAVKQLLSVLPDLDPQRLSEDLHGKSRCAIIKRHLTPKQEYDVNRLGIAGLEYQPDERRVYPVGNVAAHVVGYTDIDDKGLGGIEKFMNARLVSQAKPVALSIDLRVQTIMHRELQNAMNTFRAEGAVGIVMDVQTGELLALVSLPDFDPQHPGTNEKAMFNRATLGVYEMGSTFKIFNTAMTLDSGLVHVSDSFDATHPLKIGRFSINDFHPEHRWLNVPEIFTHSSNIGSALMAERVGGVKQRAFLSRLGLTNKMSLELTEVGAPLVPSAKNWTQATTMTVAYGQGISVSPVQLVGAVGTVVNNGIVVHPTLLKKDANKPEDEERVVSARSSAMVRAMMRLVVARGTAKQAAVDGYLMGGKTGTADKVGANGRYIKGARVSSFIGVFPLNAPKYIIFAMLDNPQGNAKTYGFATGGWTAAPVVSHVAAQMGPLLDIQPLSPEQEKEAEHDLLRPLGAQKVDGEPIL